jgi:hypothetical protein
MTRDPTAYLDTAMCDYCETEHLEDDLKEYERDKWACDQCARANDEEAAAMREMADDDKYHAMMEKQHDI